MLIKSQLHMYTTVFTNAISYILFMMQDRSTKHPELDLIGV